ncbi:hypothetical protein GCM10028825_37150 [Spirosoma agri]
MADQYVQELGHFVEIRFPEEFPDAGHAHIITGSLLKLGVGHVRHSAEFQTWKDTTVPPGSGLYKERGAG